MPRRAWLVPAVAFLAGLIPARGMDQSGGAILQELRSFRETGGVLLVAAHPDDENSRLLAYLAQGRACRTAYLSLTRGDGGQNLIGPELGDELGVIRTQELLAARRVDGARQFFSRARDFGFSKDYRQALGVWDRRQVLADVVRTIRVFRPDVIITRFPPWPSNTHGQHTASAVLALEAFKLSGDPKAFPEQLTELAPWQAKRIVWNSTPFRPGGAGSGPLPPDTIRLDVGGYQPEVGEWFGVLAARSRSQQRTQGMGSVGMRGTWNENFRLLAGAAWQADLFDGVDTGWARFGGAEIGRSADDILAHFHAGNPAASVPALLELRKRLADLPADPVVAEKQRLLDRIIAACAEIHVETVTPEAERVPGENLPLRHTVIVGSTVPVRWVGVRYPSEDRTWGEPIELPANREVSRQDSAVLPLSTALTQPFWLREEGTKGMFGVPASNAALQPENPPVFPVEEIFEIGGQRLAVADEPVQVVGDPVQGEIRRRLEVIPPVSVDFNQPVELFAPGKSRPVTVVATSARSGVAGTLRLEAPAGWGVTPAEREFHLGSPGEKVSVVFTVTAPLRSESADLIPTAWVERGDPTALSDASGRTSAVGSPRSTRRVPYRSRREDIHYAGLPEMLCQPTARLKAISLELAIRGRRIGYLPGAGDRVGEALAEMGYAVTTLQIEDLTADGLRGCDAIVLGVRCFNVRADLAPHLPALWEYVRSGGTLVVQYNTQYGLKSRPLAPFALELSDARVTDENAPVRLLAPDHPAWTGPNRIDPADFDGWVQERARYLPKAWDPRLTPLLASSDPGEAPNNAGLLVARYGRGYYVYTGLSWFRQLPAGVPGAYRIFANLVSLGK